MRLRRYKALVFATLPFLITAWLLVLMATSSGEGWNKLGYLLLLIYSIPVSAIMSISSMVFAFSKNDPNRRLQRTAKILSIVSAVVFTGAGGIFLFGAVSILAG
jgi:hypothetical protein